MQLEHALWQHTGDSRPRTARTSSTTQMSSHSEPGLEVRMLGLRLFEVIALLLSPAVGWFWKSKGLEFKWGFAWSFVPLVVLLLVGRYGSPWLPLVGPVLGMVVGLLLHGEMKKCPFCAEVIKA